MKTRDALVCLAISALPLLMISCGGDSSSGLPNNPAPTKAGNPTIPPGHSLTTIHVKFRQGTNVDLPLEALPPSLRNAVASHTKVFSLPKQKLNELQARGSSRSGYDLARLESVG